MKRMIMMLLLAVSFTAFADEAADKYVDYKWKPTRLSSYKKGNAPEIRENINAFKALAEAEKNEGTGKYILSLIDGYWFYAISHSWSAPSETGNKLPDRYDQKPTATSLEVADMLSQYWPCFREKINARAPQIEATLRAAMKRITGKEL